MRGKGSTELASCMRLRTNGKSATKSPNTAKTHKNSGPVRLNGKGRISVISRLVAAATLIVQLSAGSVYRPSLGPGADPPAPWRDFEDREPSHRLTLLQETRAPPWAMTREHRVIPGSRKHCDARERRYPQ